MHTFFFKKSKGILVKKGNLSFRIVKYKIYFADDIKYFLNIDSNVELNLDNLS